MSRFRAVRCPRCAALVIQGVPCHERGCSLAEVPWEQTACYVVPEGFADRGQPLEHLRMPWEVKADCNVAVPDAIVELVCDGLLEDVSTEHEVPAFSLDEKPERVLRCFLTNPRFDILEQTARGDRVVYQGNEVTRCLEVLGVDLVQECGGGVV